MLAVHWPFAEFLITPAARNWIFGQGYFPYAMPPSAYHYNWEFGDVPASAAAAVKGFAIAIGVAILSARVALAAGDGMARLKR